MNIHCQYLKVSFEDRDIKWFVQVNSDIGKLKWLLMWKLKCIFSLYIVLRGLCGSWFICPIYGSRSGKRSSLGIIDEFSIACDLFWKNVAVKSNHLFCLTCHFGLKFPFQLWGWIALSTTTTTSIFVSAKR